MGTILFEHAGRRATGHDVLAALVQAGLRAGDSIFVHSDLKAFGRLAPGLTREAFVGGFLDALRQAIGPQGNLIMPTFSYSFCKGQEFDPATTPSTVGMLTEHFRKLPGVKRSADPIFSAAALGPDQDYFTDVGTDCFGASSIFDKLYRRRAKLVCLGETLDITFIHFVEQSLGVSYRYLKRFPGRIRIDGVLRETAYDYNVRTLDKRVDYDLPKMADFLERAQVLLRIPLGASAVRCMGAAETFDALAAGLRKDPDLLLSGEPK